MNSRPSSSPASILRPVVLTLLAVALLAVGIFQSLSAYPGPAALSRLADTLPTIWSNIGFVIGLILLSMGMLLLIGSAFWLRQRLLRPRVLPNGQVFHSSRASSGPAVHHSAEEYDFEPHLGEDERFDQEPEMYERSYGHGYDNGYEPSRRRSRDRARFEPRRWAGSPR